MPRWTKSIEERFWEKVNKTDNPDECWLWRGCKDTLGYGKCGWGLAHRFAYTLTYGNIPEGCLVLHKCDNPSCVNPDHLYLGNDADNARDKVQRGRQPSHIGTKNPNVKLKEGDVREIRKLLENKITYRKLAEMFNIGTTEIGRIKRKEIWGSVI